MPPNPTRKKNGSPNACANPNMSRQPIFTLLAHRPTLGHRPPRTIDLVGIKPSLGTPARAGTALLAIARAERVLVDANAAPAIELGDVQRLELPVLGGAGGDEGAFAAGAGERDADRRRTGGGVARVACQGKDDRGDGGAPLVDGGCGGAREGRGGESDKGDEVGCELHLGGRWAFLLGILIASEKVDWCDGQ